MRLTYLFISHDLSVVKYITDRILVMYLGNMMELGDTDEIFDNPLHPYTQALFSAVPVPDPDVKIRPPDEPHNTRGRHPVACEPA